MRTELLTLSGLILSFAHTSSSFRCLVVRPDYGLISERCPPRTVACAFRVKNNAVEWYKSKLYGRDQLACVLSGQYGPKDRSGCKEMRSGAVRCWCKGQSNCNNSENTKRVYIAFINGDQKELDGVVSDVDTSEEPGYYYVEPWSNINEKIDEMASSETHRGSRYETSIRTANGSRVQSLEAERANHSNAKNLGLSSNFDMKQRETFTAESASGTGIAAFEDGELNYEDTVQSTVGYKINELLTPSFKPSVGYFYESMGKERHNSQRKNKGSFFHTQPLYTERDFPTIRPKELTTAVPISFSSQQDKQYQTIEFPLDDKRPFVEEVITEKRAVNSAVTAATFTTATVTLAYSLSII